VISSSLNQWSLAFWLMHVADEMGDEIFTLPFTSMLGKPH